MPRSTSATAPPYAPLAAVVDDAFTWGDDRPLRTPWHKTLIYELHVKGFTQLNPRVPESLRGTYLGLGSEAGHPPSHVAGRHGRGADAGPSPSGRMASHQARPDELLGLQHAFLLRPRRPLRRLIVAGRRGPRIQDDGAGAARGQARGDPRRGLQPYRRGQPPRPDAVATRHRQRELLPAATAELPRCIRTSLAAATR